MSFMLSAYGTFRSFSFGGTHKEELLIRHRVRPLQKLEKGTPWAPLSRAPRRTFIVFSWRNPNRDSTFSCRRVEEAVEGCRDTRLRCSGSNREVSHRDLSAKSVNNIAMFPIHGMKRCLLRSSEYINTQSPCQWPVEKYAQTGSTPERESGIQGLKARSTSKFRGRLYAPPKSWPHDLASKSKPLPSLHEWEASYFWPSVITSVKQGGY